MRFYKLYVILMITIFIVPTIVLAELDPFIDFIRENVDNDPNSGSTSHVTYLFTLSSDDYFSEKFTETVFLKEPRRCAFYYYTKDIYSSSLDDIDYSNLKIKMNHKDVDYVDYARYLDSGLSFNKFYTIFDPCELYNFTLFLARNNISTPKFLSIGSLWWCYKKNIGRKAIFVVSDEYSDSCVIEMNLENLNGDFAVLDDPYTKGFLTSYLKIESNPSIVTIRVPEDYEIIDYNLQDYLDNSTVKKNEIKWVFDGVGHLPDIQLGVVYTKKLSSRINDIFDSPIRKSLTILIIVISIYSYRKKIGKKLNQINRLIKK
ncbi:MAG: hypothetical protein AABX74_02455 [Nanoarchaeota archaeon]